MNQIAKFILIVHTQAVWVAVHGYMMTVYRIVQNRQTGSAAVRTFHIGKFRYKGQCDSLRNGKGFNIILPPLTVFKVSSFSGVTSV